MLSHRTPSGPAPAHPRPAPQTTPETGIGNAARASEHGLGAPPPPPPHELAGPLAGVLLDALPVELACAQAAEWLDNPAVAAWWREHAPTALGCADAAASAIDAVWPRGLRLCVEGDLGGHLTGGLETEAQAWLGRESDGRATAAVRTRAGVSLTQAVGTREEDAFGQVEAARRLEAAGRLTLDVLWDADGIVLGGPRLAAALLAGEGPEALGTQVAQLALEAAPDLALEAGAHARADATLDGLETHGLTTPLRSLAAPLLSEAHAEGSALLAQATRIEALGPGLLEARLTLEGTLSAGGRAALAALPALVAPEQLETLAARIGAGAQCTLVARIGATGTPAEASITLGHTVESAEGSRGGSVTARTAAELEAALGGGGAPLCHTRAASRPLSAREAEALLPLVTRALAGTLEGLGHAPRIQSLEALVLESVATVPAAAIEAARAAGLGALDPEQEVDAILAAATHGPLPSGADPAAAAVGAAALPELPSLRLRGRIALGLGGSLAAGAVEDASVTARGRIGLELDQPIPTEQAPALVAALA